MALIVTLFYLCGLAAVIFLAIAVINLAEGAWEKDRKKMAMAGRCIGFVVVVVAVIWIIKMIS